MKDTYKKHKRIIQQIKSGTYPKQIKCKNWEESDILNYLIDNGHLKGIRDQWGLVIDDISTTETTNKYLKEINNELRNVLVKFCLKHWKILLPIIITTIVALFIHFDSKSTSKAKQEKKQRVPDVHIVNPPNINLNYRNNNNQKPSTKQEESNNFNRNKHKAPPKK